MITIAYGQEILRTFDRAGPNAHASSEVETKYLLLFNPSFRHHLTQAALLYFSCHICYFFSRIFSRHLLGSNLVC